MSEPNPPPDGTPPKPFEDRIEELADNFSNVRHTSVITPNREDPIHKEEKELFDQITSTTAEEIAKAESSRRPEVLGTMLIALSKSRGSYAIGTNTREEAIKESLLKAIALIEKKSSK